MIDPGAQLQALLQGGDVPASPFPPNSRYNASATLTYTFPDGRAVAYLARRFVPRAENINALGMHTVTVGDRLDNLAARHLGDAEQYWRLCDANGAMRPDELVETPGRELRIGLPEGIG